MLKPAQNSEGNKIQMRTMIEITCMPAVTRWQNQPIFSFGTNDYPDDLWFQPMTLADSFMIILIKRCSVPIRYRQLTRKALVSSSAWLFKKAVPQGLI